MSAPGADRVRAFRIKQRQAEGKAISDIEAAWFAKYLADRSGGRRKRADVIPPPLGAPAPRPSASSRVPVHETELLPAGTTPESFMGTPRPVAPPVEGQGDTPAAAAADAPTATLFGPPVEAGPDPEAVERAAQRAGAIVAVLVAGGLASLRELVRLRGEDAVPPFVAAALASPTFDRVVLEQVSYSAKALALKYGVARVLPYEDECVVGGALVISLASWLAVRDLRKDQPAGATTTSTAPAKPAPAAAPAKPSSPPAEVPTETGGRSILDVYRTARREVA